MEQPHTDKKPTNWMRIAGAILIPLFTVWYIDRENRINDLKQTIIELKIDKDDLKADKEKESQRKEYWIDMYINCERQIPQLLDTLKVRIKQPQK